MLNARYFYAKYRVSRLEIAGLEYQRLAENFSVTNSRKNSKDQNISHDSLNYK